MGGADSTSDPSKVEKDRPVEAAQADGEANQAADSREAFHALISSIEYPVLIVTACAGDERSGCLIGFFTQASMDPPRMLAFVSKLNHTLDVAQDSDFLAVHFLSEANRDLAELFGEETGDRTDKFSRCSWKEGPGGVPILSGVAGWVVGRILGRFDMGDHIGHLLDVSAAGVEQVGPQLGFQEVRGLRPGHPAD